MKVRAIPVMAKRGWMPTWWLNDFMSMPCISIWQNKLLGQTFEIVHLNLLVVHQPPTLSLEVGVVDGPHQL